MHIVGGKFKNRILKAPKGDQTRPTASRLREALFNICQGAIEEASFLDLFAGSGAIGFEALSRGASHITLVDSSRECAKVMHQNAECLKVENDTAIVCCDVFSFLKKFTSSGKQFDIIFADPPYQMEGVFDGKKMSYSQQLLQYIDNSSLLRVGGYLYLEDILPDVKSDPHQYSFKSLTFISSRRAGKTSLLEFRKEPGTS